ncbi:hypothetical protein J6590_038022 [Homalodisca vitripennis]|nr:hypothetical protein J6590_038022 [Homalodisca vitripennis]
MLGYRHINNKKGRYATRYSSATSRDWKTESSYSTKNYKDSLLDHLPIFHSSTSMIAHQELSISYSPHFSARWKCVGVCQPVWLFYLTGQISRLEAVLRKFLRIVYVQQDIHIVQFRSTNATTPVLQLRRSMADVSNNKFWSEYFIALGSSAKFTLEFLCRLVLIINGLPLKTKLKITNHKCRVLG